MELNVTTIYKVRNVNGSGWLFVPKYPRGSTFITADECLTQLKEFCAKKEAAGCIITSVAEVCTYNSTTPRVAFRDSEYKKLLRQAIADEKAAAEDRKAQEEIPGRYRCPRCGHQKFGATAHVTQGWLLDEFGNFDECVTESVETTHAPDEGDIWKCDRCGYDGPGKEFRIADEH